MQVLKHKLHHARPASAVARAACGPVAALRKPIAAAAKLPPSSTSSWMSSASSRDMRIAASRTASISLINPRTPARRTVTVVASWGAEVAFAPAKVMSSRPVAAGMHQVIIDVGDLAAGYTKAGQYVQVKVGDSKPGFFAIASPPDANNAAFLELLIKSQPESTAELLCNAEDGAEVLASPVMGKGFAVEKIPASEVHTVYLFATGSGISPVKALIESGALEADKRKDVRLYYGTHNAESSAYLDKVTEWTASGVNVTSVFSTDGQGYVQDVFAKEMQITDPKAVAIVLCGQKGMCEAIKALAAEAGVDSGNVLLNF